MTTRPSEPAASGQQRAAPDQVVDVGVQGKNGWVMAVAGTAATAIPAGPGLVLAVTGHSQAAVPLLITSGVAGLISVLVTAVVKIYDSVQQTRRLQIQYEGITAIATAVARSIDGTHKAAESISVQQHAVEAAGIRAAARQTVTELLPVMLAVISQQPTPPNAAGH